MEFRRTGLSILVILAILFSSFGVMATDGPITIKENIVVTEDGGKYQVGFVNIEFKKDFLDGEELPKTFEVEIYVEDGKPYIEFSPDIEHFNKKVHIRVNNYNGFLYDKSQKENIKIDVKKNNILADHFSRYCLIR